MKFSKRILTIFLALLIFISVNLTPVSAVTSVSADTETIYTSGDYQYKILDDGTIEITDYFGNDTDLIIPSTIKGYNVSVIGEDSFYNGKMKSVIIPNGVKKLGDYSFNQCRLLQTIDIPDTVTEIGKYAFQICESLESITIPNGVETIREATFNGCNNLIEVSIPDSVTSIEMYTFLDCENLKKIVIPPTVVELQYCSLGYYTFEGYDFKDYDFNLYGYANTAAETYAIENEIKFIPLDKGDADESTVVDIKDVTCMQKIIAKITATNDFKTANCDLNGDGKLNIRDVTLLQLYLANKIDSFPVQE